MKFEGIVNHCRRMSKMHLGVSTDDTHADKRGNGETRCEHAALHRIPNDGVDDLVHAAQTSANTPRLDEEAYAPLESCPALLEEIA